MVKPVGCAVALALFVALPFAWCAVSDPPSTPQEMRNLAEDPARQARLLLKVDYSRLLDQALAKKPEGLRGLFRFTTSEAFVGAGAESHCTILRGLLRHLGDQYFARMLRREQPHVRTAVIHALDYAWPHPGWKSSEYPATFQLARHEKTRSSPP